MKALALAFQLAVAATILGLGLGGCAGGRGTVPGAGDADAPAAIPFVNGQRSSALVLGWVALGGNVAAPMLPFPAAHNP